MGASHRPRVSGGNSMLSSVTSLLRLGDEEWMRPSREQVNNSLGASIFLQRSRTTSALQLGLILDVKKGKSDREQRTEKLGV